MCVDRLDVVDAAASALGVPEVGVMLRAWVKAAMPCPADTGDRLRIAAAEARSRSLASGVPETAASSSAPSASRAPSSFAPTCSTPVGHGAVAPRRAHTPTSV
ncbi:hypothetical protein pclt_cds_370 [Pandoravirus celtis]|uniref:Uncharacterized protein n=1 Tax=Pandoravirus celtis TaxID=2568002 RepID=A0A4D6EGK5_9VIRU|nr:hypothetical protein pclt_cds_370 [Pandoravirus celtis]